VTVNVTNEHFASDITVRTWDFKMNKKSNKSHFKLQVSSRLLEKSSIRINCNLSKTHHINFQWRAGKQSPCVSILPLDEIKDAVTSLIFSSSIQSVTPLHDTSDAIRESEINIHIISRRFKRKRFCEVNLYTSL
jgi:hypothetical protein